MRRRRCGRACPTNSRRLATSGPSTDRARLQGLAGAPREGSGSARELISDLYLAPGRPTILELNIRYIGENPLLGVTDRDGSQVDTRSHEYVIEIMFKSELPEREAFKLAEDSFGTIAQGFRELPVRDPVEIDWSYLA